MIRQFITGSNWVLFFYYLFSNIIYLLLLVVAIHASLRHQQRLASIRLEKLKTSPLAPPISLVVPAHNEEATIVESVRSMMGLDYPALEVIVVNDGSKDGTLAALIRSFHLLETDLVYVAEMPCKTVRRVFMSPSESRLLVIDKEAGGSKADAANAGLNAASSPYVCIVDGDALLERDALLRIMAPLLTETRNVVAAGGIVRVANGSDIQGGVLHEVRLPRKWMEVLQVVEYLRTFLMGREGWAEFNLLLIISGAFGIFRRDLVRAVGGYRAAAIGEDLDLVVRMHRHMQEKKEPYHVSFIPDPVCWTEVPSDLGSLGQQRARWQRGLFDVLWRNRVMFCNRAYGRIGLIAVPYQWIFELVAPVIEVLGYTTMILAAGLGMLSQEFFLQFLVFGYAFATMISIGAVLLEEITYRRYNHWRDVARLILFCFLEHFPYRQLQMLWRLRGLWQYLRGERAWGPMRRVGFGATAGTRHAAP